MCTTDCVRPLNAGLTPDALNALADLYAHPAVRVLADVFRHAGGHLFLVGGPVRGALTGTVDFADLDFTTNLHPAQIRKLVSALGPLWTSGERFGTIGVIVTTSAGKDKVEITTFRKEVYTHDSRKPDVSFGDDIVDDLRRRDLTVNAIALNVVDGCLVDPFGGITDLADRILDTPDDPLVTLTEDPLRILRALRFAGRLNAALSPRLQQAAAMASARLTIISAERKLAEFDKLVDLGPGPAATGIRAAIHLGAIRHWIPAVDIDADQMRRLGSCQDGDELLLAITGPQSDDVALRAMTMPVARIRRIRTLSALLGELDTSDTSAADARSLLRRYSDADIDAAERLFQIRFGRTAQLPALCRQIRDSEPAVRARLPITGDDLRELGLTGPRIGAALRACEQQMCEQGALSTRDALTLSHQML